MHSRFRPMNSMIGVDGLISTSVTSFRANRKGNRMKRAIVIGAATAALFAHSTLAADIKVGVVNLQKCFEEYYKTKSADITLKEAAEAYNKERQQLITEFQKLQEERNKLVEEINKPELSAAAKADNTKESEAKLAEL